MASLGFNSINLDSKSWADFFARYHGEPASPYVAMHEFMMAEMAKHGLDYTHLALYLCGDNLYPNIRDVALVRGEESIRPNGQPMGTYKYGSPQAQATMIEHVRGLLKLYGQGIHHRADGRITMMTMWEPTRHPPCVLTLSFANCARRSLWTAASGTVAPNTEPSPKATAPSGKTNLPATSPVTGW